MKPRYRPPARPKPGAEPTPGVLPGYVNLRAKKGNYHLDIAMDKIHHKSDRPVEVVTDEMRYAGADILLRFIPELDSPYEAAKEIYLEMCRVRQTQLAALENIHEKAAGKYAV